VSILSKPQVILIEEIKEWYFTTRNPPRRRDSCNKIGGTMKQEFWDFLLVVTFFMLLASVIYMLWR
jgi:hypothetical protein